MTYRDPLVFAPTWGLHTSATAPAGADLGSSGLYGRYSELSSQSPDYFLNKQTKKKGKKEKIYKQKM